MAVNGAAVRQALSKEKPGRCFMHPERRPGVKPVSEDIFTFQFWPSQLVVDYSPNYAQKDIPGASHPLYQWIGGGGRSITFTAQFVAETRTVLDVDAEFDNSTVGQIGSALFTPSARYTVDVGAALARLQSYMMPTYSNGASKGIPVAPPRMRLYFPGMGLGGGSVDKPTDDVLTILRSGPATVTSWFPNGEPKIAEVSLQFSEVVQQLAGSTGSAIRYIDSSAFSNRGKRYSFS